MILGALSLVHLSVSPQVGYDREVATATVNFTRKGCRCVSGCLSCGIYIDVRFSPVWLYMCVCRELGRVKRLSQILHLCFFCELDETFELNCPIMDWGAGGMLAPRRALGRGKVLELVRSTDSEAEL